MNQQEIASLYREINATSASPSGAVVKLYDRIIEDLRRAGEANASRNIEKRVSNLNHALLIIAELEGVLDFERGGTVAKHLQGFYRIARGLILEANVRASEESIEEIVKLFTPLREAWQQVERDSAKGTTGAPERVLDQQAAPANGAAGSGAALEPETAVSGSGWSA